MGGRGTRETECEGPSKHQEESIVPTEICTSPPAARELRLAPSQSPTHTHKELPDQEGSGSRAAVSGQGRWGEERSGLSVRVGGDCVK